MQTMSHHLSMYVPRIHTLDVIRASIITLTAILLSRQVGGSVRHTITVVVVELAAPVLVLGVHCITTIL
jgi:hypothetical protein